MKLCCLETLMPQYLLKIHYNIQFGVISVIIHRYDSRAKSAKIIQHKNCFAHFEIFHRSIIKLHCWIQLQRENILFIIAFVSCSHAHSNLTTVGSDIATWKFLRLMFYLKKIFSSLNWCLTLCPKDPSQRTTLYYKICNGGWHGTEVLFQLMSITAMGLILVTFKKFLDIVKIYELSCIGKWTKAN